MGISKTNTLFETEGLAPEKLHELKVARLTLNWDRPFVTYDTLDTPLKIIQFMTKYLQKSPKENAWALYLDFLRRPIFVSELGRGEASLVAMDMKEIAQTAILCNAESVIMFHNHPSIPGVALTQSKKFFKKTHTIQPSESDITFTQRLSDCLGLFGIELCDHIIVDGAKCDNRLLPAFYSMRAKNAYTLKTADQIDRAYNIPSDIEEMDSESVFHGPDIFEDSLEEK